MYILIERGELYEPYCDIFIFETKEEAIKELREIAETVKRDLNMNDVEVDEEFDSFYLTVEGSSRFIEASIQEVELNKEIYIY